MITVEEMADRIRNREPEPEPAPVDPAAAQAITEVQTLDMAARIAAREAALTAAGGNSWKWQLRGIDGRWIDMGSHVSWMSSGRERHGKVTDSRREGWAQVVDDDSGVEIEIPTNRLKVTDTPSEPEKQEIAARQAKAKAAGLGKKGGSQPEPSTIPESATSAPPSSTSGGMPQEQVDRLSVDGWKPPPATGDLEKDAFKQKAWDAGIGDLRGPDGKVRPGRPDGTGTAEDPIYVGRDIELAQKLLLEEKHIRMESQQDLIRLLDTDFGQTIKDSGKTINMCLVSVPGTNLFCAEHKGVTRVNMPQLAGKDKDNPDLEKNVQPWAEEMLEGMGLIHDVEGADPHTLAASQNELVTKQIIGMKDSAVQWYLMTAEADFLRESGSVAEADAIIADRDKRAKNPKDFSVMDPKDLTAPILVTDDGYIIDGHHRWASTILLNEELATMRLDPIPMQVRRVSMEIGEALVAVNAFADAAGIARKSGGGAAGETPKVLQKDVSPEIEAWIKKNMSKVLEELNARPPGMENAPLKDVWNYNVDRKKASNAKRASDRRKAALAASLSPGDILMMDDDSVRMVLKVIAQSADSIAVLQADPDTDQFDLTVLASAAPVVLL